MRMRTHYGQYAAGETVDKRDEKRLREEVPELIFEGEGPVPPIVPQAPAKTKKKSGKKSKAKKKGG